MAERRAYFDNAKWLIIILIILDHFVAVPLPEWLSAPRFLGQFVVLFAMPVLAIISGHMCRGRNPGKIAGDSITRYLLPYFLVQILWAVVNGAIGRPQEGILIPNPSMYYLIVLAWWRLLLAGALAAGARLNLRLSGLVVFGLTMGFSVVERLDANCVRMTDYLGIRMLPLYMPYFFAGYFLREEHFAWLAKPGIRPAGIRGTSFFVFCGTLLGMGVYPTAYLTTVRAFNPSGTNLGEQLLFEAMRIGLTVAALSLIPWREVVFRLQISSRRTWALDLTRLGRYTLYPYMFHAMLLYLLAYCHRGVDAAFTHVFFSLVSSGASEPFSVYIIRTWGDWWRCGWAVGVSIALFFLLSSGPFRRVARFIAEPAWAWKARAEH